MMLTKTDLQLLADIAKQAGDAILTIYDEQDLGVVIKQDDSPVTKADLASHQVIVNALKKQFSQFPILSEEDVIDWETRRHWQTYWLIDPLDGTKEFIKRNGEFTVNIALIHLGKPVAGVVYAPVLNKCYIADTESAWLIDSQGVTRELNIRDKHIAACPVVVGSRSHISQDVATYLETIGKHELVSVGSSLKFCMVAEGIADCYPRLGLTSEWDTAAAQAIVEGAGGKVIEYPKLTPLTYNQKQEILNPYFIAASQAWFSQYHSN